MISRAVVGVVAALAVAGYAFIYSSGRAGPPIRSDGFSYYVYLPAWFIHRDTTLRTTARACCEGDFPGYTGMFRWPGTRRWVNPHPIGVALMQAPFFLFAHAVTWASDLPLDGFSFYYQHAAGISGLFWTIAGLLVLGNLLRRHFSDPITAATLVVITFGTNLFHYATYDSGYSHAYSFFLFAAFLNITERWHHAPSRRLSVLAGIIAGLIVLVRHTNGLFLLVFPLYGVTSLATLRTAARRLLEHKRHVAEAAAVAALVILPQLAIYMAATGRPIVSAYGASGFNFSSPHIVEVLFSVQKGLFFWSPILLAAVAGLVRLWRVQHSARVFVLPAAVFLTVNTWLIACWWDWQFGGSYGHRGFVDVLAVFALGLAAVFEWCAGRTSLVAAAGTVSTVAVALSVFQMLQYWNGTIPFMDTTWERYLQTFLKWR